MNGFGASQGASFRYRRTASGARGRSVRLGRPEAVASVAMAGRICPVSFTLLSAALLAAMAQSAPQALGRTLYRR